MVKVPPVSLGTNVREDGIIKSRVSVLNPQCDYLIHCIMDDR